MKGGGAMAGCLIETGDEGVTLSAQVDVEAAVPAVFDTPLPSFLSHGFMRTNAEYLMGGGKE